MDLSNVLSIIFGVISIAVTIIAYYYQIKSSLIKTANGLISAEEDTGKIGTEKKKEVVSKLYLLVPSIYRPILNVNRLNIIVQELFDTIEDYAQKQTK